MRRPAAWMLMIFAAVLAAEDFTVAIVVFLFAQALEVSAYLGDDA